MDNADIAQRNEQQLIEINMKYRSGSGHYAVIESSVFCCSCEDEIPEERRLAVPGCRLCVECQALAEKRRS